LNEKYFTPKNKIENVKESKKTFAKLYLLLPVLIGTAVCKKKL